MYNKQNAVITRLDPDTYRTARTLRQLGRLGNFLRTPEIVTVKPRWAKANNSAGHETFTIYFERWKIFLATIHPCISENCEQDMNIGVLLIIVSTSDNTTEGCFCSASISLYWLLAIISGARTFDQHIPGAAVGALGYFGTNRHLIFPFNFRKPSSQRVGRWVSNSDGMPIRNEVRSFECSLVISAINSTNSWWLIKLSCRNARAKEPVGTAITHMRIN